MSVSPICPPGQSTLGISTEAFSQMVQQGPPRLLTTKEAARYLGVSEAFLERDRWAGARIPFIKVGSRAVRYELSALDAFIAKQRRRSTSEEDE